jgi:hypothetical protein
MTDYTHTSGVPSALSRGVSSTIRTEFDLIQTAVNSKANTVSPTLTGVPTAPTASLGVSTTQLATTAFVSNTAFSTALPAQSGNNGKFVTTDGTNASWGTPSAGAMILISTTTATGTGATVDIEGFSSTYDDYVIIGNTHNTTSNSMRTRWKFAGAYETGANYDFYDENAVTITISTDYLKCVPNNQNDWNFIYRLQNINSAYLKSGRIESELLGINNILINTYAHQHRTATTALQGVRFYESTGQNITGVFKLYGITKA